VSQATVRSWDPETGGTVFLDDGTVVEVPREALQGSVFRFLRAGQRVRLELEEGVVVAVGLP
jgi:cold shock CspA family protein